MHIFINRLHKRKFQKNMSDLIDVENIEFTFVEVYIYWKLKTNISESEKLHK